MANVIRRVLGLSLAFAVYHVVSGNKPAEPKSDSLKAELLKTLQHKDQTEDVVTEQHIDNDKNVRVAKATAVSAGELGEVVKKVKPDQDVTLKRQGNIKREPVLGKEKDKQLPRVLKEAGEPNQEFRTTKEKNNVKEVPDCYVNVTLEGSGEGTLNSPQYPSNYDNELHCVYRIQTQPGYFTQLTFQDFKLEPGSACMYDSVQVFANNGTMEIPLSDKHCGNDAPVIEAVDYNLVMIVLKTDFSQTATGFLVDYRVFIPGQRCMFGAAEDCAFECHCANDNPCNSETGACICKNEPPSNGEDDFVGDVWTGIGCQTGNVALHKPAYQSGTGFSADPSSAALYPMSASKATDGYSGLLDWAGHCAWVVNEDVNTRAWWIVDLGALHQVITVTVYNTEDSEKSKTLGYISLKHSQEVPNIKIMQGCNGMTDVIAPGDSYVMKCRKIARYVGIERVIHPDANNTHTMALCEVQVMAHKYYDVDCSTNGTCVGNCYPGLYCDRCHSGYRQPECTKVEPEVADCGVPEILLNGTVSYNDTVTGSVANYTCDVGYTLQGSETIVCDFKGLWKDVPVCEKVNCGAPPLDDSAESLDYTGTLYEDIVYYECADGNKLIGNAILRCTENGTWDNPAPKCELMTCGSPPDIPNAYLTGITGNVWNSVATYMCEEGFVFNGESADLVCDIGGNWSSEGERLQCTGIPCKPPPPSPTEHSYVSYSNGSVFTSVVEYKCEERYYMPGVEGDCFTITCMGNGRWNDIPPHCIIECGGLLTNETGMITSPNWPNSYDSNRKCTWLIKAPRPGDKIVLRFLDFDVEMATNCSYDHMNVYESNGKVKVLLDTYCGDVVPAAISTVGNYLLLELISDPAEEGTGFRAEYSWLTADSMEDVSAALGKFYPELLVHTVVQSDINLVSEAVAYLKSYMLTIENLFHYAECLFVLEAEDGIENILYYHSVPRLKQYLYNTFDRMIYHMPQDYHTAQVIMQLIESNNLTSVYNKLTEPLIALQINVQHIVGLEHFQPEPVIFSSIEEPLLEKMVEHQEEPAAKVVLFMVETLHQLVIGRSEFDIEKMNCPPLEATAVNLVQALENATQSLAIVMASLQGVIDTAFGPGASDIVDIYKHELIEQIHILHHPFHVLIGVRNEVLRTFTLKAEVGEPQSNHSKSSNELDVEKYIKSTEPLSAAWLEYVIGENLELGILSYIQKDVEHHLLKSVPHAADEPIEDISLVAYELMAEVFHDRIVMDMPGYCLDGKLTAMLTGFLEVHLVDIAMSDLNISKTAKAIADLLVAELTADTDGSGADIYVQTLESNIASKLRARLFNMFRGRLLVFDRKLEAVTRGPVSTETLPMDVIVIITSEKPTTMGELITKVVELTVPTLLVNVTCTKINWTKVDDIVKEFLNSFDDLTMEVLETYEEFPLTEGINTTTADSVKALINTGLTRAKDQLIYNFRHLHLVKDGVEDQSALTDFFIENLALSLYNIVQMVTPYEPPALNVNVEGLMEVIEWQHDSLQELILVYMQGLRKLMDELSDDHFNLCEEYPHICKLSLLDSLTTKRNQCVSCAKN